MVISINPKPEKREFQALLDKTLSVLQQESRSNQKKYLSLLGKKFEDTVAEIMIKNAKGTPFENSIELISGQKFPDIIANNYYGVEVKTTKQDHWKTIGNSILEGTRVEGVERIHILFGKMVAPVEFKCRLYEDCLSEVVVTHSPRYLINMNLSKGETIFDKLNMNYDTLRKLQNPVKPIIKYYREFLKPGEDIWWLDREESIPKGLIIQLWNNLPREKRNSYMLKAMILFPEVFSNQQDKFNRFAIWMVNKNGIVCPNTRDIFTAGGKGSIAWKGETYNDIPRLVVKMTESLMGLKSIINMLDDEHLSYYWKTKIKNKYAQWVDLVVENTSYMKLQLDLKEYLND